MVNKVAWITGAGSGIGEASAIKLASKGFSVVLSGRTKETLDMVASKCKGQASVKALDVSNYEDVKAVFEDIISEYGRVDVLVASAGLNAKKRNWHNVTEEDFDQIIKIDLNGVFYTNRLVLEKMKEQRGGVIINVSSWAGKYVTTLTGPAYTAAKHGVNALTEGINMEAGHFGVRACALCPGEVATPILDKRPIPVSKEDKEKMVQPEDCAETVAFLATLPPRVCINEITISPTWNRLYVAGLTDQIPKN
ncbi:SDR family oxidoreductase [Paracoccaceae bacterium]|nr:SDR family oxidoreductase [Paracoccaceae bacterium]